jgi:hypothetical protein
MDGLEIAREVRERCARLEQSVGFGSSRIGALSRCHGAGPAEGGFHIWIFETLQPAVPALVQSLWDPASAGFGSRTVNDPTADSTAISPQAFQPAAIRLKADPTPELKRLKPDTI